MGTQATVLSKRAEEDTVITTVQYDYTGDYVGTVTVEVYHYRPISVDDITTGIITRGESEKRRLQSLEVVQDLLNEIPTEING
jgi:hypothetical protein